MRTVRCSSRLPGVSAGGVSAQEGVVFPEGVSAQGDVYQPSHVNRMTDACADGKYYSKILGSGNVTR